MRLSNHQQVPSLPNPVSAVSDVHYESGSGQAVSCVYPVTQPPPVTFSLPPYYVPPLGLGASTPAPVTTSATHWQPTGYISPPASLPGYETPPKPEMTFLLPVCMPSSEAGQVVSPTGSVGSSPTIVTTPPPLNPLMNSTNMEIVWHGKFSELFATFPHPWTLKPTDAPPQQATTFNDSAKVRFLCKNCGNAWTSMKGRVIFWIQFDAEQQAGVVYFKLFGQQCQKCMPGTFEHSMWYPEEVVKVVENVFNRVGQLFYGFRVPVMSMARRTGRPRTQHNSKLCQACALNICREAFRVAPVLARA